MNLSMSPGLPRKALRWLDKRVATAVGSAEVRAGLIRMALRRQNIPELAALAFELEGRGRRKLDLEAGR